jgi:methylenetetrahydrofolate dehydrogenase (NADP+)/methenyltetrahydrofolate cyclohydrolase
MPAEVLDGTWAAGQVKDGLRPRIERLRAQGVEVGLATVLVGDDPASARYVEMKHAECQALGIRSFGLHLRADTSMDALQGAIRELNSDARVHSMLVQLPLPRHLDQGAVLGVVEPAKDVDGLHPVNLGMLLLGTPTVVPCTPAGIVELLRLHGVTLEGRHLVIVGRGVTIGRPLAALAALNAPGLNAAVTVVHSRVADLGVHTRRAEVLVSAAGAPRLITPEMVTPGAVVVGAGTSFEGRRLLSDVDEQVAEVASFITPRKGGVGPMTVAMLLANAVAAAERASG